MISDKCPYHECDGSGLIVVVKEDLSTVGVICPCLEQKQLMRKIQSARIPDDYANVTVKEFDPAVYKDEINVDKAKYAKKVAIRFVEKYYDLREMGKGLYFYSHIKGSGKTHLAISITNALIQKYNVQPLYISSVNLLSEIKNTFNQHSKTTSYDLLIAFKEADVLVIDDLGVEKSTEWSEEILTEILEERMNYNRLTIITSNIPVEQLSTKYPAGRIESRIENMTFPISMPEESVRRLLSKKENDRIAEMFFK
ncbi:ATP-binding protein [Psychrobacillus soli]|uniref:ATP-binding protein n=1 Tax=Psychrobacillus soli TaxID=1543965 RepID=UPI00163C396A|nr:ATP-binding protein [Psychrobacillus soli]